VIASPLEPSKIQTFSSVLHQGQGQTYRHSNLVNSQIKTIRTENVSTINRVHTNVQYTSPITKPSEAIAMTRKSPQVYYSSRVIENPAYTHQQAVMKPVNESIAQQQDLKQYHNIRQSRIETTPTRSSRIIVRSISPNYNGETRQQVQSTRQSILDGEESGIQMRELYIAPEKLRELKQQSKVIGSSQLSSVIGNDKNEVSTYDYEVLKADNGTRKYFLKRDPSQSVLERSRSKSPNLSALKESATSRINVPVSPIQLRRLETETIPNELIIEDKQLQERYSNIQLKENTSDYKVFTCDSSTNKIEESRTPIRDVSPSIRVSVRPPITAQTTIYNINSTRPSATFVNAVIPSLITEKR